MIYLLLSILLNVWIFIAFRSYKKFRIPTLQAVVVNYFVCALVGVVYGRGEDLGAAEIISAKWFPVAIVLGFVFVVTFYAIAFTTQKSGVTVASIASRMSLVIPVIFALFIFDLQSKRFDVFNYLGILMAVAAVILASLRANGQKAHERSQPIVVLLPGLIFLLQGAIDTIINYSNSKLIPEDHDAIFPVVVFATAGLAGAIFLMVKGEKMVIKSFLGGLYLGIPNYFSIYFILKALTAFDNDGALLFPILNTGIIALSTLAAVVVFNEKVTKLNIAGVIIAIISIYLVSYQEIHSGF